MTDDRHYRVLKHLAAHPNAPQRDLATALGISLGSTNFRVRAVIDQAGRKSRIKSGVPALTDACATW